MLKMSTGQSLPEYFAAIFMGMNIDNSDKICSFARTKKQSLCTIK